MFCRTIVWIFHGDQRGTIVRADLSYVLQVDADGHVMRSEKHFVQGKTTRQTLPYTGEC